MGFWDMMAGRDKTDAARHKARKKMLKSETPHQKVVRKMNKQKKRKKKQKRGWL